MPEATQQFEVLGEEDAPATSSAGGSFQILGEEDPSPQLPPEVEKAIRSVPRPQAIQPEETESVLADPFLDNGTTPADVPPTPSRQEAAQRATDDAAERKHLASLGPRDYAAGAVDLAANAGGQGVLSQSFPGAELNQGITEAATPGKRLGGAAKIVGATGDLASPLLGAGAISAPAEAATGVLVGMGASKGAQLATKAAGGGQQAQDLATQLGFWLPAAGGVLRPRLGIGISPDEVVVGAGIKPPGMEPRAGAIRFPRGSRPDSPPSNGIEPPTIEGNPQPPAPPPGSPQAEAASALAQADQMDQMSARAARGLPPVPPPPGPPPPPPPLKEIKPQDIAKLGQTILGLPPEQRAQGVMEAHDALTKMLLVQGKIIGPDGKLEVVDSPKSASNLAQRLINDEVDRRDEAAAAQKKAAAKTAPTAEQTKKAESIASLKAQRQQPFEVVGEEEPEVESANAETDNDRREQGVQRAGNAGSGEAPTPGVAVGGSGDQAQPARVGAANPSQVLPQPESSNQAVGEGNGSPSGYEVVREEEAPPTKLKSGDKIVLPDGRAATVDYSSPTMNLVRLRADDGQKQTISGAKNIAKLKSASDEEPAYKYRSTQANIPDDSEAAEALKAARDRIAADDLIGDGKDIGGNHVTVRYGLKDGTDLEPVRKYLSSLEPFEARLGITDVFPPSESSEGGAVVHAPIISPELRAINDEIQKHGEFAPSNFPEYEPHATIAYVKPEATQRYKGMGLTSNKKFKVDHIAITDREGGQERVKLAGKQSGHPAPGKVGEMRVADLHIAPHRFQFKLGTDSEGTSPLLKNQLRYNPDLAGTISVWKDPEDGKYYVINGHHRFELARRTRQKTVAVRHIIAGDAIEARAVGARQNIAEGRGTPVDAGKFFRDSGVGPEDLEEHGISLGEATAEKGLALSRLDTPIFNRVVSGDLPLGRAVAIGESTSDPAEQKAILDLLRSKERLRTKVSDDTLRELIRFVKNSGKSEESQADLFGTQTITKSHAIEKAEISAYVKQQLGQDKKLFGTVSKTGHAERLTAGGNTIDVERSRSISTGAAQAEEVYNKLSERGGPISDILDAAAARLAEGENGGKVKSDAYERIRSEVRKTLSGTEGQLPERVEAGAGRGEAAEAPAGKPEDSVEPTLPGMEQVPAERAEANAEQQGKDLTAKLTEPPKSIEAKAGDIEQHSPLFRDTEANPQGNIFGDLFKGESGSIDPAKLAAPVAEVFKQDVAPALAKAGTSIKEVAGLFVSALYPRIEETSLLGRALDVGAPTDAVDALMKLKGERARAVAEFDGIMHGMEKMFDRMPEAVRIDFIDRMQTGAEQSTAQLREIADAVKKIQDDQRDQEQIAANLGRPPAQQIKLPTKENYFNNRWDTPPGGGKAEDEETRISRLFTPRRPLEGTKSYNKQQRYTLKTGIEAGGKPTTTNPVRLLRLRIEDGMKFVSARRAWDELGKLDLRQYVQRGERIPEGFSPIDDRIARVYFPAELASGQTTAIEGGQWVVEGNTARLLNNMLSRDRIRTNAAGAGLMWLKNASTAIELGLSPFHAVFETIEAASSQLSLGMLRTYNLGVRGADAHEFVTGLRQMLEAPVAPATMAREGAALPAYIEARARLEKIGVTEFGHKQVEGKQPHGIQESLEHFRQVRRDKNIQRLLKRYPDLDQLVDDMFTGGMVIGQHADYQVKMLGKTAMESWTAGNPLGAIVRAVPTILQGTMKPLFQWYIPNLKYSLFLRMMSEQAAEHAADLESGALTRAQLARKVVDSVENRFGEMNFDNLFWRRTMKSALQFGFRSVTWKLGTAREIGGAAAGQAKEFGEWAWQAHNLLGGGGGAVEPPNPGADGKIPFPEPEMEKPGWLPKLDAKMSWVMSLLLTTAALGTIASKVLSGKYPWEWTADEVKDKAEGSWDWFKSMYRETVHPRTGEKDSHGLPVRINLPTYLKEIENALKSPARYVVGSLSGIVSKAHDIAENEDYFGNYVYNPNASTGTKLKQIGKYAAPEPFALSGYERGKDLGQGKTSYLSAFGFPRAPADLDFTPAEKMAHDLGHKERLTPEQLDEWKEKRDAVKNGTATRKEMHSYVRQQRLTWLQRDFKGLSYRDALRVYGVASEQEKAELSHLLREKRRNLRERGRSDEVRAAEAAQ